jgi:protein-S-isoprenylcysteine O-methyltransferase Ste14
MPSPLLYVTMPVGGVLALVGAYVCVKWYTYWKRSYKGKLLTDGLFSRVRHPLYSGFLALVYGVLLMAPMRDTIMLAGISTSVVYVYVRKEEEFLLKRYGRAYREYMERVPWRLIPRVY